MYDHRDADLRNAQCLRYLPIAEPFEEAQREHFRLHGFQPRDGSTQRSPEPGNIHVHGGGRHQSRRFFRQRNRLAALPRPDHIQRRVDRRAPQITVRILKPLGVSAPPQHPQKHRLQHVFRVPRISGNPVGRAEDQAVVGPENLLEFIWNRDCRFLLYAEQVTPPHFGFVGKDGRARVLLHSRKDLSRRWWTWLCLRQISLKVARTRSIGIASSWTRCNACPAEPIDTAKLKKESTGLIP